MISALFIPQAALAKDMPMDDDLPAGAPIPAPLTVANATDFLAPFLASNPLSRVELVSDTDQSVAVKLPWGDESLYFKIPSEYGAIIAALNNVILPERFVAMWHKDTRDFEIIFVALPLVGTYDKLNERSFTFNFQRKDIRCEFGPSSDRLLTLAENVVLVGATSSNHRNMYTYKNYIDAERDIKDAIRIPGAKPWSFWIRDVPWDQEQMVMLARHLNFYMPYYDARSPTINILPPKQEPSKFPQKERYVIGHFPTSIRADELSSNLMHYWTASHNGDPFRRFLYNYQIIEYAAQFFIDDKIKRAVKNVLALPHLSDDPDGFAVKILELAQGATMWDGNKVKNLVKEIVDPKLIWREVEKQKVYFARTVEFDGGQTIDALIAERATEDTFCHNWHDGFCDKLRTIRNALSHSKEHIASSVIAPTPSNFDRIQPWLTLISVAAGEVMARPRASI
jgi:hypothetical protein